MRISDYINVALCVLSFLLAAISVVTVVITLRQNHKMIENSTRPYIVIKYRSLILQNGVERYIVVKNYGQTGATITEMAYDGAMTETFLEQFKSIKGAFLAPSQRLIYFFDGPNFDEPETITFKYKYTTGTKDYSRSMTLKLINGSCATRPKTADPTAYALRELVDRFI